MSEISFLFKAIQYSIDYYSFVHSSVNECLGCFCLSATVNETAMNSIHKFLLLIISGIYSGVRLLDEIYLVLSSYFKPWVCFFFFNWFLLLFFNLWLNLMWDLSPLPGRVQTRAPCMGNSETYHWTTREFREFAFSCMCVCFWKTKINMKFVFKV